MKNKERDTLLNVNEVAELLGVPVSRVRFEVFNKKIPFLRIGRTIRFSHSDLADWLNTKKMSVLNE